MRTQSKSCWGGEHSKNNPLKGHNSKVCWSSQDSLLWSVRVGLVQPGGSKHGLWYVFDSSFSSDFVKISHKNHSLKRVAHYLLELAMHIPDCGSPCQALRSWQGIQPIMIWHLLLGFPRYADHERWVKTVYSDFCCGWNLSEEHGDRCRCKRNVSSTFCMNQAECSVSGCLHQCRGGPKSTPQVHVKQMWMYCWSRTSIGCSNSSHNPSVYDLELGVCLASAPQTASHLMSGDDYTDTLAFQTNSSSAPPWLQSIASRTEWCIGTSNRIMLHSRQGGEADGLGLQIQTLIGRGW